MLELQELLERVRRESLELGIPSIDPMDGTVLYTVAYTVAVLRGASGVVAVDAGAGVGYSSLWIAAGLAEACCRGCRLYLAERDPVLAEKAGENLARLARGRGLEVVVHLGDAVELLEALDTVDMVFVDVEKEAYPRTVSVIVERLSSPGAALWHNAFYPPPPGEFYARLSAARRLSWSIVPTPAGLVVAWRLPGRERALSQPS
jgi:predicted O-methyltransferase YrrM